MWGAAPYSTSVTMAPRGGITFVVDLVHCDVGHEPGRSRAVPVVLARLEEHAVPGPNHLDRAAAALRKADALRDVDRPTNAVG
jgi:hypothetical protein